MESIAPAAIAASAAACELTPIDVPRKPGRLRARPKDAPIRPVPTIATEFIDVRPTAVAISLQLAHQFVILGREQRLRAIAYGMIRVMMNFHQQAIRAGGDARRKPSRAPDRAGLCRAMDPQ